MDIPFVRVPAVLPGPAALRVRTPQVPGPAAPGASDTTARPADLVARALAILDEERAAWQAKRPPVLQPRRAR